MQPETDNNVLELYREIDKLAQIIFDSRETQGSNRGRREHRRETIETQKDASPQKNFIPQPVFVEDAFVPHTEGSASQNVTEQGKRRKREKRKLHQQKE